MSTGAGGNKGGAAKRVLSTLDRAVIDQRIESLKRDFGLLALRAVFADTTDVRFGDFDAALDLVKGQPRRRASRQFPEGYRRGDMSNYCRPWLDLMVKAPGQVLTVRHEDLDLSIAGMSVARFLGVLGSLALRRFGPGTFEHRERVVEGVLVGYAIWHPEGPRAFWPAALREPQNGHAPVPVRLHEKGQREVDGLGPLPEPQKDSAPWTYGHKITRGTTATAATATVGPATATSFSYGDEARTVVRRTINDFKLDERH